MIKQALWDILACVIILCGIAIALSMTAALVSLFVRTIR